MTASSISNTSDHQTGPDIVGARLEIDLDAIAKNWQALNKLSGPAECGAAVKADAYGLGLSQTGRALHQAGCRTFFVSQAAEGVMLRQAVGSDATIYILNGPLESALPAYRQAKLSPVINTLAQLELWRDLANSVETKAALQLDTGMQRLGLSEKDCIVLSQNGFSAAENGIGLLMSHLASADQHDATHALSQKSLFDALVTKIGGNDIPKSLANSAGVSHCRKHPELAYDLTRPGIALYGAQPYRDAKLPLSETVQLKSEIIQLINAPKGSHIGYGNAASVERDSAIATIPVGYGDGYLRSLSHCGFADIDGHIAPIVGRVSMDLLSIDVTDIPASAAQEGSPLTLIGGKAGLDRLAFLAGTIPYELLTNLSHRIPRFYKTSGMPDGAIAD